MYVLGKQFLVLDAQLVLVKTTKRSAMQSKHVDIKLMEKIEEYSK